MYDTLATYNSYVAEVVQLERHIHPENEIFCPNLILLHFVFAHYLTYKIKFFAFFAGLTDSAQLSLLQNDGSFVILCTLYLLLGLAILAMCFSIFRDTLRFYPRLSSCFGMDQPITPLMYKTNHLSSWVYNETPS